MRRALLLTLGLIAVISWQFAVFPGHSYLRGESQLYIPVLERLDAPGYLSRDLVATHPHVTFTIYDEVTLFLHEGLRLSFPRSLALQQLVFSSAGVIGVFVLIIASGVSGPYALLLTALTTMASTSPGIGTLFGSEPVPRVFALGLALFAMGALARRKPLLAGLAAGMALLYDFATSIPIWITIVAGYICVRSLRPLLRPCLTILFIFLLLLGNLAQLQPGAPDAPELFSKVSASVSLIQQMRTPQLWISHWSRGTLHAYLAVFVIGVWALARIWQALKIEAKWLLTVPACLGILSIPYTFLLLDRMRWALIPQLEPAQTLTFTVLTALAASGIAAHHAWISRSRREAAGWLIALILLLGFCIRRPLEPTRTPELEQLATWAEANTWGSSLFLFPGAGHDLYPGSFRALSRRAVWVDWESGCLVKYAAPLATEWWERWRQLTDVPLTAEHLNALLLLPIDYFVLQPSERLVGVHPVFVNREFAVYDAQDLKSLPSVQLVRR